MINTVSPNIAHKIQRITDPYRIWICDGFFPDDVAARVNAEWPERDDPRWHTGITHVGEKESVLERGLRFVDKPELYTPSAAAVIKFLNSNDCMFWLSGLTGIGGLFPDETYRWSGMRVSYPGSFQLIHQDAMRHPVTGFRRHLTLLYYLTNDYVKERDAGCMEVWSPDMKQRMHEIEPICNRLVVFECIPKAFHGVPRINHERRFLMASAMTDTPVRPSDRALFVPRPEDSEEVRAQGAARSTY